MSSGPSFGDDFDEGSGRNCIDEINGKAIHKRYKPSTFTKKIKANAGDAANASAVCTKVTKQVPSAVVGSKSFRKIRLQSCSTGK